MPNIQDSFLVLQDEKGYLAFLKHATKSTEAPEILSALLDTLKVDNPQSISRFLVQYLKDKPNIEGLKQILSNWKEIPAQISREELLFLVETMAELVQKGGRYQCGGCGFKAESFEWSCPSCNKWGKYKRNMLNLQTSPAISSSSSPGQNGVELQSQVNHTA
jgi:lipopolysaccharide biosynthesis regulator YciM